MPLSVELNNQHQEVTRRYFIQLGAAGALAFKIHSVQAETNQSILDSAVADMGYLTAQAMTLAHWATLLKGIPIGVYDVRCRTIDQNGIAQPMPRPFRKSGRNTIQRYSLTIQA